MSDYGAHVEIEPRVHLIRGLNRSKFPEANSILVDDEILTLIDAGSDIGQVERTLKDLGHKLDDLDRILLTHFHIDHKGHAQSLHEASECEVLCHPLSDQGIETFPGMVEYYGITSHPMYDVWRPRIEDWAPHVICDYTITGHFSDMKPISCGEVELTPIHLPGHTIDHTCFGINGLETVFLVDIDLTRFGPWYGNKVSDIREFENSVRQVIDLNPKVGISSHLLKPVVEDLDTRLEEFLQAFDDREKIVLESISEGNNTLEKLVYAPTIYPHIPEPLFYIFEEFMLKMHLEILLAEDKLSEAQGVFQVERK